MDWQLAQLNVAVPTEPLDTPGLADFVAALAPVNALADAAPGFVWRLQTEEGDATAVRGFGYDRIIVNLSVWESLLCLADFVYGGEQLAVMRRRRQWFLPMQEAFTVLWWVPAGHRPTVDESAERLDLLRDRGPSKVAFTFRTAFDPPVGPITPDGLDDPPRTATGDRDRRGAGLCSPCPAATGTGRSPGVAPGGSEGRSV